LGANEAAWVLETVDCVTSFSNVTVGSISFPELDDDAPGGLDDDNETTEE